MLTIPVLKTWKQDKRSPLVMITSYTAPMTKLMDGLVDLFLVGDSLGMMVYGMENTLDVSLELMINHGRAVVKASQKTSTIIDMPFGSYEASPQHAFHAASRLLKETGCLGVKLEGGAHMVETVRFLSERGIPVMSHIGMTPQAVQQMGGFRVQGKNNKEKFIQDAKALEGAGAFALVIECVPESLAAAISSQLSIPTIGIGASPTCDGQVLVIDDMLGLVTDFKPKFLRHYAELSPMIQEAVQAYAHDVRTRQFPTIKECYSDSSTQEE